MQNSLPSKPCGHILGWHRCGQYFKIHYPNEKVYVCPICYLELHYTNKNKYYFDDHNQFYKPKRARFY